MSAYDSAFILAAGEGRRMRPFTEHTPKPMADIGGETLVGRILDQCAAAGIAKTYINTHHLAAKLTAHVEGRVTRILHEPVLLNTGYGVKKALPYVGDEPFYVLSGDGWWRDGASSVFAQMEAAWHDGLDLLLVLQRIDTMTVTPGVGDYHLEDGRAERARGQNGTHMFTSIRLCRPRLFDGTPDAPFSFLDLMDKAEAQGRLGAIEMDGIWQHLTDMRDIGAVNAWLERGA